MKRAWLKIAILLVLVAGGVLSAHLLKGHSFTLQDLKQYKEQLLLFVGAHYLQAVLLYILLYLAAALFFPGALVLTVAGGLVFGTVPAAIYADLGATAGAVLAFLAARFILGDAVQKAFQTHLTRFNKEMESHGHNYLLVLRIFPVAPFFVINYGAGLTRIPLGTYVWTTSLGMFPGALLHAFLGEQLRYVSEPGDLRSGKLLLVLALLVLLALVPVLLRHLPRR